MCKTLKLRRCDYLQSQTTWKTVFIEFYCLLLGWMDCKRVKSSLNFIETSLIFQQCNLINYNQNSLMVQWMFNEWKIRHKNCWFQKYIDDSMKVQWKIIIIIFLYSCWDNNEIFVICKKYLLNIYETSS